MKQAQTGEWRTMRSIYWTRRWSTQVVESAARWKRWWSKFSAYGSWPSSNWPARASTLTWPSFSLRELCKRVAEAYIREHLAARAADPRISGKQALYIWAQLEGPALNDAAGKLR